MCDDNWRSIGVLADCGIESAVFELMKRGGADLGETSLNPALAAATLRPATVFELGPKKAPSQRQPGASQREVPCTDRTPSAHREKTRVFISPPPDAEPAGSALVFSLCVMVHAEAHMMAAAIEPHAANEKAMARSQP